MNLVKHHSTSEVLVSTCITGLFSQKQATLAHTFLLQNPSMEKEKVYFVNVFKKFS